MPICPRLLPKFRFNPSPPAWNNNAMRPHTRWVLIGALIPSLLLGACVHPASAINHASDTSPADASPAGTSVATAADTTPIWATAHEMAALQAEMNTLRTQVAELQQQQAALSRVLSARATLGNASVAGVASADTAASGSRLQQAQQQYRAGLYGQAVRTLAGADGGGNGDAEAQSSMYLLIQSHQRLNNCESVINVGNRFANRFARNPQAADALWQVAQCQWQMQQQDIARDTWRKIIQIYPDSAAAKRAWQRLK